MSGSNIHIYPSAFKNESRILKETDSIIKLGLASKVEIIALWQKGLLKKENISDKIIVYRLTNLFSKFPTSSFFHYLKFILFNLTIFFKYKNCKIKYITCHSLSTLLISVIIKKTNKGSLLIYDAHELETERAGLGGFRKKMAKITERRLIKYVDSVIVVSESINRWYKSEYPTKKIYTIKNTPNFTLEKKEIKKDFFRNKFNIPKNQLIFIYQGLFSRGRGIDILIDVFSNQENKDKHIVFMGYGVKEEEIKLAQQKHNNIHFQEAVKPHEIVETTQSADVGISLIENIGLSYYYCLPNKIFEYMHAGIPVIASDFPDLTNAISNNNIGWNIQPSVGELNLLLKRINFETVNLKKQNLTQTLLKTNSWENQESLFIEIFKNKI